MTHAPTRFLPRHLRDTAELPGRGRTALLLCGSFLDRPIFGAPGLLRRTLAPLTAPAGPGQGRALHPDLLERWPFLRDPHLLRRDPGGHVSWNGNLLTLDLATHGDASLMGALLDFLTPYAQGGTFFAALPGEGRVTLTGLGTAQGDPAPRGYQQTLNLHDLRATDGPHATGTCAPADTPLELFGVVVEVPATTPAPTRLSLPLSSGLARRLELNNLEHVE